MFTTNGGADYVDLSAACDASKVSMSRLQTVELRNRGERCSKALVPAYKMPSKLQSLDLSTPSVQTWETLKGSDLTFKARPASNSRTHEGERAFQSAGH